MSALDPRALGAWSQAEAGELFQRLARLGAAMVLMAGPPPALEAEVPPAPPDPSPPPPAAAEASTSPNPASWALLASKSPGRWRLFGASFRQACLDVLADAGIELSREGLAQQLADRAGLPHWQDDASWGKAGHEELKAKLSSEMGRMVKTGQVRARTVATGRRGETRLMWRLPPVPPDPGFATVSAPTGEGTGTGAGPGGIRPSSVSGRTPSHD